MQTWPEWKDPLGRTYKPGDIVGVATVSYKPPQLVIGRVVRINRTNSRNEEHVERARERVRCNPHDPGAFATNDGYYRYNECTKPSCSVTVKPLLIGRGFRRWSDRTVTYRYPENIVKLADADEPLGSFDQG